LPGKQEPLVTRLPIQGTHTTTRTARLDDRIVASQDDINKTLPMLEGRSIVLK